MALGKLQRETLQWYADKMPGDPKTIIIKILPWRRFTREAGGGAGFPVTVEMIYNSDQERERSDWLATCSAEQTAVAKGQEIGRHLCDVLGLSRESVKLRWNNGNNNW